MKTDDPYVLGILLQEAYVRYDLADYVTAQPILAKLIDAGKTGTPMINKTDPTTHEMVDVYNVQYWESMYKLMRCNIEIAKMTPPPSTIKNPQNLVVEVKAKLKDLYTYYPKPGGDLWFAPYEELRTQLIPDWKVPTTELTGATTKPATAPAPSISAAKQYRFGDPAVSSIAGVSNVVEPLPATPAKVIQAPRPWATATLLLLAGLLLCTTITVAYVLKPKPKPRH